MTGILAEHALRLSYELEEITTRGDFLRAAAETMGDLLPGDQLGWLAVNARAGKAEVYGTGGVEPAEIVQALARFVGGHPILHSYRDRPKDMTPRRVSDLIAPRDWRSHPVYCEVYRPLGAVYQLCIPVTPFRDDAGACWAFNRTARDFTDDDMVTATRLQPVLTVLNHASARAFCGANSVQGTPLRDREEAIERTGLTPREAHVLKLLAAGLTATAIGHVCRISPRTVRKHLENIYTKLGCHDRLLAVRRAADLGLV